MELSADVLLRAAMAYFVSAAGDLMLTTRNASNGVCVEFNHLAKGDEYEIVAWGRLRRVSRHTGLAVGAGYKAGT